MHKKFPIDEIKKNLATMKKKLPIQIAAATQRHFMDNFRTESFGGDKWEIPNRRKPDTDEYKYPKNRGLGRRTRNTLVKSGRLRRAYSNSIREKTFERITAIVDLDYAEAHHDGVHGIQSVRAHNRQNIIRAKVSGSFIGTANRRRTQTIELLGSVSSVKAYTRSMNIPQRKVMGQNRTLTQIQLDVINKHFAEAWEV